MHRDGVNGNRWWHREHAEQFSIGVYGYYKSMGASRFYAHTIQSYHLINRFFDRLVRPQGFGMTPAEIARSYDQLADQWNSDEFPRNNGIEQHKRAIAFLKEKRHALDIGCGSSGRIIELLTSCGFDVEGLDISDRMIELAKRRHPSVTFYHADICSWEFPRKYDLISAWDSIWHIPLMHQKPVLTKILQGLTPGGVCIFTMGGLDAPSEKVDSAMGPQVYYSVLGIPNTLELLSDNGCICRNLEYDQYPQLHLYVIAQRA